MAGIDASTKLYLPLNCVTNNATTVNGALEVLDSGSIGKVITSTGVVLSTSDKKLGSTSLYNSGSTNRATFTGASMPYSTGTMAFWIKTSDVTTFSIPFGHGVAANNNNRISFYILSGAIHFIIYNSSGTVQADVSASISANTWTHVIATWATNSVNLYVNNGSPASDTSATMPNAVVATGHILNFINGGYPTVGYMDDIREFSDIITSDERATLYNSGSGTTSAIGDEVLWLKMDTQDLSSLGGNTPHIPDFIGTAQLSTAQTKYAGDGTSLLLDGNSDYITIPDSADWDVFGSTGQDYTIDFWVKWASLQFGYYVCQYENSTNYWYWYRYDNSASAFGIISGGSAIVNVDTPSITDTNWHHLCMVKKGGATPAFGIYQDGVQIDYVADNSTDTLAGTLQIGRYGGANYYLNGYMAHFRIQASNIFNASPNVGLTDTITVPTAPYSVDTPPAVTRGFLTCNSRFW